MSEIWFQMTNNVFLSEIPTDDGFGERVEFLWNIIRILEVLKDDDLPSGQ